MVVVVGPPARVVPQGTTPEAPCPCPSCSGSLAQRAAIMRAILRWWPSLSTPTALRSAACSRGSAARSSRPPSPCPAARKTPPRPAPITSHAASSRARSRCDRADADAARAGAAGKTRPPPPPDATHQDVEQPRRAGRVVMVRHGPH